METRYKMKSSGLFGLKKKMGPLEIIIPIYQSWDNLNFLDDPNWFLDKVRFSLSFNNLSIGDLF